MEVHWELFSSSGWGVDVVEKDHPGIIPGAVEEEYQTGDVMTFLRLSAGLSARYG